MTIKRFVVSDDSPITFQPGDMVKEVHPGQQVVIERDVPDAPEYHVGVVGTATIENKYGVVVPNVHGVWVETARKLFFRAFVAKSPERAAFPERRVVHFVPDPTAEESMLDITTKLTEAVDKASRADRRAASAEKALRKVADDLHLLRSTTDPLSAVMTTSQGATMQRWLSLRKGEQS